jgi:pyruvate dehydrogenase E2 component (dihydrolipoamide acetyltransferase)
LLPVIQNAGEKGLIAIAAELGELASRARSKKLSADEMKGASISITNLGGLGTTHFTPIIPFAQVAIISVGRARPEAVWQGETFEPRQILPLGITYDHRAIDGADAARFLRFVCEVLEEPLRLTMEA